MGGDGTDARVPPPAPFAQTFSQCLLLACPGVLFGSFLTGLCAMFLLPYAWNWNLAMAFGSILAATDPVAVVALLKSVGASKKLTMQITGESLMNDGTAIVLFTLFMDFYNGRARDAGGIAAFFTQMSIAGPLIGLALGLLAVGWMSEASRKFSHSDVIVQTAVTVCCAYLSFFLGESEARVSGVLTTVAAALVLAKFAWPVVVSHEALENVWHAFEYFGNTLIFMLAGVITRRAMSSPNIVGRDYALCLMLYALMTLIRALMILLFYPLLSNMGPGTTPKDAFFMVYGGLRGAVGLALAISVRSTIFDEQAGDRIVFQVSGLAFLTLMINGTTSGALLRRLGMVGVPELKKQMIAKVRERVVTQAEEDYSAACAHANTDAKAALSLITNLRHLHREDADDTAEAAPPHKAPDAAPADEHHEDGGGEVKYKLGQVYALVSSLPPPNEQQVAMMRETLLQMVRAEYWEMIEEGHLPAKANATLELLKSVDVAIDNPGSPLNDWAILEPSANIPEEAQWTDRALEWLDGVLPDSVTLDNELHYLVNFKRQENAYYICHAFVEAHTKAQRNLAVFFGDDPSIDTAEEGTVILESLLMTTKAAKLLSGMSQSIVKHIKTMVIAEQMVDMQHVFVHKLIKQGILTETDADEFLHQLEHDSAHIRQAKKDRARNMARAAVKSDLGHGPKLEGDLNLRRGSSSGNLGVMVTDEGDWAEQLAHDLEPPRQGLSLAERARALAVRPNDAVAERGTKISVETSKPASSPSVTWELPSLHSESRYRKPTTSMDGLPLRSCQCSVFSD